MDRERLFVSDLIGIKVFKLVVFTFDSHKRWLPSRIHAWDLQLSVFYSYADTSGRRKQAKHSKTINVN